MISRMPATIVVPVDTHELFQPQLAQLAPSALTVIDVDTTLGIFLPGMAHAFVYKPVLLQLVVLPLLVCVYTVEP